MITKRVFFLGFVVLILLVVGSYAFAQPVDTEATLLVKNGQVQVQQPQTFLFFTNNTQTVLTSGELLTVHQADTIKVASSSSAVLTMGDGTSTEMFPNTIVEVSELFVDDTNFRVRLTLLAGKTVNRVQRLLKADDAYEVRTPSSTASVRGTVFVVDVVSAQETFYSVDEGLVAVKMAEQEVLVEAGFEVLAVSGQPLQTQPQAVGSDYTRLDIEPVVSGQPVTWPETDTDSMLEAAKQTEDSPTSDSGIRIEETNTFDNQSSSVSEGATQAPIGQTDPQPVIPTETTVPNNGDVPTPDPGSTTAATTVPQPVATATSYVAPTATLTNPDVPAVTATSPGVALTATRIQPTATKVVIPSATPVAPTPILVVPTNTSIPPTATLVPPPTNTPVPPPTNTPVPPPTNTPVPPTEEPKVTLCHNGNTISVDQSSVQSHLDHGDYLGPCN